MFQTQHPPNKHKNLKNQTKNQAKDEKKTKNQPNHSHPTRNNMHHRHRNQKRIPTKPTTPNSNLVQPNNNGAHYRTGRRNQNHKNKIQQNNKRPNHRTNSNPSTITINRILRQTKLHRRNNIRRNNRLPINKIQLKNILVI